MVNTYMFRYIFSIEIPQHENEWITPKHHNIIFFNCFNEKTKRGVVLQKDIILE